MARPTSRLIVRHFWPQVRCPWANAACAECAATAGARGMSDGAPPLNRQWRVTASSGRTCTASMPHTWWATACKTSVGQRALPAASRHVLAQCCAAVKKQRGPSCRSSCAWPIPTRGSPAVLPRPPLGPPPDCVPSPGRHGAHTLRLLPASRGRPLVPVPPRATPGERARTRAVTDPMLATTRQHAGPGNGAHAGVTGIVRLRDMPHRLPRRAALPPRAGRCWPGGLLGGPSARDLDQPVEPREPLAVCHHGGHHRLPSGCTGGAGGGGPADRSARCPPLVMHAGPSQSKHGTAAATGLSRDRRV
jgi:hypothetical protein